MRGPRALMALAIAVATVAACGGSGTGGGSTSGSSGGTIALLLPDTITARYESKDRPLFEARVKALCAACTVRYANANQSSPDQQSQAEAALTNGAKVLVLDAVDGAAAAGIAQTAKSHNVPVVSYDRLILNSAAVNYYISFDNVAVGKLQGTALLQALSGKSSPAVVMINGDPADNNAKLFKQGAHSVLDGKVTVTKEYDTPKWSGDAAQTEMQQALTALSNKVDGVYAANDTTGGAAIAALKSAGLKPLPPVTGQDADLAAIQRILLGDQYMTVYKAIKPEAEGAAELAVDLATGKQVPASKVNGKTNNGAADVPSVLLTPAAVTKSTVSSTVIQDGFWTKDQICTTQYADACKAAGIS
jgi:D-xylose transport system substrate-binding protein